MFKVIKKSLLIIFLLFFVILVIGFIIDFSTSEKHPLSSYKNQNVRNFVLKYNYYDISDILYQKDNYFIILSNFKTNIYLLKANQDKLEITDSVGFGFDFKLIKLEQISLLTNHDILLHYRESKMGQSNPTYGHILIISNLHNKPKIIFSQVNETFYGIPNKKGEITNKLIESWSFAIIKKPNFPVITFTNNENINITKTYSWNQNTSLFEIIQ